jgi:hypothetical protein
LREKRIQKHFAIAVSTGVLFAASLVAGPAGAQTTETTQTTKTTSTQTGNIVGQYNPYCGAWADGEFKPNGNCVTEISITPTTTQPATTTMAGPAGAAPNRVSERVSGKIIMVNKNMITLQHGDRTLIVNDSRALSRGDTGHVATGRDVVAHGYWEDGTFYANRFD